MAMGLVLFFTFHPNLLPAITHSLERPSGPWPTRPFIGRLPGSSAGSSRRSSLTVRFDYWEVRPNELLHHHGFSSNLERLAAPNLRIDKEINDVFEYLLLRSGRLILQGTNERAILLDNVPFIDKKEEAITQMSGALQVQVRDGADGSKSGWHWRLASAPAEHWRDASATRCGRHVDAEVRPDRQRDEGRACLPAAAGVRRQGPYPLDGASTRSSGTRRPATSRRSGALAGELHWFKPFTKVLEWDEPFARWFVGGRTNVSLQLPGHPSGDARGGTSRP